MTIPFLFSLSDSEFYTFHFTAAFESASVLHLAKITRDENVLINGVLLIFEHFPAAHEWMVMRTVVPKFRSGCPDQI